MITLTPSLAARWLKIKKIKQKITRVLRLSRSYVLGTGSVCVIESAIKRLGAAVRTQKKYLH